MAERHPVPLATVKLVAGDNPDANATSAWGNRCYRSDAYSPSSFAAERAHPELDWHPAQCGHFLLAHATDTHGNTQPDVARYDTLGSACTCSPTTRAPEPSTNNSASPRPAATWPKISDSPDSPARSSPLPGLPPGAAGLKAGVALLRQAFPDFRVAEDDLIAEGDKVVARCTTSGTHEGEFMGAPPSGKSFRSQEIMIARFRHGRIVELWSVVDEISQRQQLGWL